jgi:hypothetical protein
MTEVRSSEYFAIIPEWVVHSDISSNAVRLYAVLNRFANSNGKAWPSRRTIAEIMHTSTATVDRAKDELVEINALTVEHRTTPAGDPSSNIYTLHTSSPMTKGSPKGEGTGMATGDALNRDSMKQRKKAASPPVKTCQECLGKFRTGFENPDEEGRSHIWDNDHQTLVLCPVCFGFGTT